MSNNSIHTQAMNLARRLSIRAENDLLRKSRPSTVLNDILFILMRLLTKILFYRFLRTEESFMDDREASDSITEEYCSSLLRQLKMDSIPQECHQFASFRAACNQPTAFVGMNAGEALEAQSAREHGRLNQAQILRRMSSRSKANERSWF
jgi:hypothetical protein